MVPGGGEVLAVPARGIEQLRSLLQVVWCQGSEVQLRSCERRLRRGRRGGKQARKLS